MPFLALTKKLVTSSRLDFTIDFDHLNDQEMEFL
jgi:hypothetical protein